VAIQPLPHVETEQERLLVAQAQQGDRSALDALVEPWRRPLFGYIYRMVTHRQDAEDLLQDVLVRVLESLRLPRPPAAKEALASRGTA
jgi:DNA-directed RNA polymerase specialized sigma24 family protein